MRRHRTSRREVADLLAVADRDLGDARVAAWQALPELMGAGMRGTAVYFASCRALRNRSDYDHVGVVSEAEVDEVLRETDAFRGQVIDWLSREHPRLVDGH